MVPTPYDASRRFDAEKQRAAEEAVRRWRESGTLFFPDIPPDAAAPLADTLDSQSDSRALLAAASLQLARSELVIATQVKTCPEASRASSALEVSSAALDRGVGEGSSATELYEAYGALRSAVDNAVKVLCPPPPAADGSGPARPAPWPPR